MEFVDKELIGIVAVGLPVAKVHDDIDVDAPDNDDDDVVAVVVVVEQLLLCIIDD